MAAPPAVANGNVNALLPVPGGVNAMVDAGIARKRTRQVLEAERDGVATIQEVGMHVAWEHQMVGALAAAAAPAWALALHAQVMSQMANFRIRNANHHAAALRPEGPLRLVAVENAGGAVAVGTVPVAPLGPGGSAVPPTPSAVLNAAAAVLNDFFAVYNDPTFAPVVPIANRRRALYEFFLP